MAVNPGGSPMVRGYVGLSPVQKVYVSGDQIWPVSAVPDEPQYLYDVEQVNKPNRSVDFTALKGFIPDDLTDESFIFRCVQQSGLNGYVSRTFTKSFAGSSYAEYDCHLEDQYGDGTANPDMRKSITFKVHPTGAVADTTAMPVGAIKGNADSGLYHTPDSAHYDETDAEQWFTTEAEAKSAGFVKYTGE